MILIIVVLLLVLFAGMTIFADTKLKNILALIACFLFVGSIALLVANTSYHFGMKKVTTTEKTPLVSSVDMGKQNVLLYQPFGTENEKIYLYRTSKDQKEPTATETDEVTNSVVTGSKVAEKETTTTSWTYSNGLSKFLFKWLGNDNEYEKATNTFNIPDSWLLISTEQAGK